MARTGAVWGIDLGQCALKALRCHLADDDQRIEADAFDYIEYPKILSQPDANPSELINEALQQFLSRNSVRGDEVAISVSGQAGLARFIKLPPVEAKKIPDIVRYEAKQQIPFDLNDVVWDYQRLGMGTESEGFALETEIGLFAMKRDAVFRTIEPFQKQGIEIDYVQLTPLTLYNYLLFDELRDLPPPDEYDPENPPESVVILSLGTDATDLVITNGYRVWQRSIPLGGNHFTKALTKEMKLTFAKAEHLKRNAAAAADPKAVFQAMRPVFNELLTQLQRSLSYFGNLDRAAKIGRVVALGNAMKLPGLRRFLSQSLGYDIQRVESYRGLTGKAVLSSPIFQENALSFGVSYGLVLQGLGKGGIYTNLLPREIVNDRLIRSKKPWAIAAAASLLLGCGISFGMSSLSNETVNPKSWSQAESAATGIVSQSSSLKSEAEKAKAAFTATNEIGHHLVGNVQGRVRWLELLKAVESCLPSDPPDQDKPADITQRNELHITNLDSQRIEDASTWFAAVKKYYQPPKNGDQPAGDPAATGEGSAEAAPAGPTGPGWIVKLEGYHWHNNETAGSGSNFGAEYVRRTLLEKLNDNTVTLPDGDGNRTEVSMKDLGITFPVLINPKAVEMAPVEELMNDSSKTSSNPYGGGASGAGEKNEMYKPQFRFLVQFFWQPTTFLERKAAQSVKKRPPQWLPHKNPTHNNMMVLS